MAGPSSNDSVPNRRRGRALTAALIATLALVGVEQALIAAPAGAATQEEQCADQDWSWMYECEDPNGGGGSGGLPGDGSSGCEVPGNCLQEGAGGGSGDGRTQYEREHQREIEELDDDIAKDGKKDEADRQKSDLNDEWLREREEEEEEEGNERAKVKKFLNEVDLDASIWQKCVRWNEPELCRSLKVYDMWGQKCEQLLGSASDNDQKLADELSSCVLTRNRARRALMMLLKLHGPQRRPRSR
jgi:hypothetical protein